MNPMRLYHRSRHEPWAAWHDYEQALKGEYQDRYYRYLQACRDYPFFEHPEPDGGGLWTQFELARMQEECEREFARTI